MSRQWRLAARPVGKICDSNFRSKALRRGDGSDKTTLARLCDGANTRTTDPRHQL